MLDAMCWQLHRSSSHRAEPALGRGRHSFQNMFVQKIDGPRIQIAFKNYCIVRSFYVGLNPSKRLLPAHAAALQDKPAEFEAICTRAGSSNNNPPARDLPRARLAQSFQAATSSLLPKRLRHLHEDHVRPDPIRIRLAQGWQLRVPTVRANDQRRVVQVHRVATLIRW